jgi:hypothetical protein
VAGATPQSMWDFCKVHSPVIRVRSAHESHFLHKKPWKCVSVPFNGVQQRTDVAVAADGRTICWNVVDKPRARATPGGS